MRLLILLAAIVCAAHPLFWFVSPVAAAYVIAKDDPEEYLTLSQASKRTPGRPHINTVRRWCNEGFCGIKLPSKRVGKHRIIKLSDLDEFLAATTVMSITSRLNVKLASVMLVEGTLISSSAPSAGNMSDQISHKPIMRPSAMME